MKKSVSQKAYAELLKKRAAVRLAQKVAGMAFAKKHFVGLPSVYGGA